MKSSNSKIVRNISFTTITYNQTINGWYIRYSNLLCPSDVYENYIRYSNLLRPSA